MAIMPKTGENNMNYLDAIASVNASNEPSPEDVVNDQLEWEKDRRDIANGMLCDDGYSWSYQQDYQHLFGRPSVTKINGISAYEWNKKYEGINWKRNRFNKGAK